MQPPSSTNGFSVSKIKDHLPTSTDVIPCKKRQEKLSTNTKEDAIRKGSEQLPILHTELEFCQEEDERLKLLAHSHNSVETDEVRKVNGIHSKESSQLLHTNSLPKGMKSLCGKQTQKV